MIENDISLEQATTDDIANELRRRGVAFALYVSHIISGDYVPGGDIPPLDREKVYGDEFCSENPLALAANFYCAFQLALCIAGDNPGANVPEIIKLSAKAKTMIFADLEKLYRNQKKKGG